MRTVEVELKAKVAQYVAGMQQAASASKESATATLALSKAELSFEGAIAQATAAVKANGATLDTSTAKGRANKQSLDQIATASREYRATLTAQGKSQAEVTAATDRGRAAWTASASAMGMGEGQAKRLSGTLFAATRVMKDHRQEVSSLSMSMGILGAGMLLAAGRAVKGYADFDRTMSSVAATGDDARASLEKLRAKALEAGAATQYSATEAAQGVTNLIKAGVKAEDVLGGGLAGALNLAAAGQMSVADAAETAAITLAQFGLKGRDVVHVADLLVSGANAASGEVSDMAEALKNVGGVAHQMGYSIEETVGFLTEMAYAGQIGAEAGTQLKSMFMALQAPSAKQQGILDELNLSLFDNAGHTKKLTQFIDEYRAAMDGTTASGKKLTDAEKLSYNAIIFGSYGIQAANIAYTQAGGSLDQWIKRINDQGAAQRQASILTDNLTGDVERLGGSLDTVFIQSGSGANNVLRQMSQGAEALVNEIGKVPGPLLAIATTLTGSAGLAVLGVAGIGKLGSAVMDARDSFKLLGFSAKTAKLAVIGVGGALAIGTIALSMWADAQATAKANTDDFASTLVVVGDKATTTASSIVELNDKLMATKTGFMGWGASLFDVMGDIGVSLKDALGMWLGNEDATARVTAATDAYKASVLAASMGTDDGSGKVAAFTNGMAALAGQLTEAQRTTLLKAAADKEAGIGAKTAAHSYGEASAAVSAATAATADNTGATSDNATALAKAKADLDGWITAQWAAADAALALSGSQVGFERMLDTTAEATKKLVKETKKKTDLTNIDTKAGQDAKDILDQIATVTLARVKALEKTPGAEAKATAEMEKGRKALVAQARQMGFSEGAIADLVNKYDQLPENVTTTVGETGASEAETRVNNLMTAIKKLPKKQQAKILSEFNNKGITAAEVALKEINGKTAKPKIAPELTKTVFDVTLRYNGGRVADGGMFGQSLAGMRRQFDSGGFAQPQVRPFQGAAGVNWGEQGSGPWEAFISGAPQKKDRSLAIWRDVGSRLGAFTNAATGAAGAWGAFADGGVAEPNYAGHPLSFWQDKLKTPLEFTQLQISIRDLNKDLAETESYNPPGKRKKATRLKLRDLDRTEAQQRLAEDQADMKFALQAQLLNKSKSGSIDAQISAYEAKKTAAETATDAANTAKSNASQMMQPYMQGSSAADLIANMQAGAQQVATFNDLVGKLDQTSLSDQMVAWLRDQGVGASSIAEQILSGGQSMIDSVNAASGNLSKAADAAGQSQSTGKWVKSPVLSGVTMPGYMASGAAGSVVNNKQVTFNVSQLDPQGAAVFFDQQLRYL